MVFKEKVNIDDSDSIEDQLSRILESYTSRAYVKSVTTLQIVTNIIGFVLFLRLLILAVEGPDIQSEDDSDAEYDTTTIMETTTEQMYQENEEFVPNPELQHKNILRSFLLCLACLCGQVTGIYFYRATKKFESTQMCAYIMLVILTMVLFVFGLCVDMKSHEINLTATPLVILHFVFFFLGILYIQPVYKELSEKGWKMPNIRSLVLPPNFPYRNRYTYIPDSI